MINQQDGKSAEASNNQLLGLIDVKPKQLHIMQNERKNSIKARKGTKGEKFDENGVKIRVLRDSSEKNDRRIGVTQLKEHEISDDQESQN